jgi:hypothetical protein
MPVLDHFHKGRPFDIMESNVAAWLAQRPEIRQEMFNYCKRIGAIVYEGGKWRGVATRPAVDPLPSNSAHKIAAAMRVR